MEKLPEGWTPYVIFEPNLKTGELKIIYLTEEEYKKKMRLFNLLVVNSHK